jgi:hypothetical protein
MEDLTKSAVDRQNVLNNKELLFEIITSLIYEDEYSEELKLKIIHVIST